LLWPKLKKERAAMECIFCRIASKGIPSEVVFEDEQLIVIKDLHPQAPTHLLVMPKAHYESLLDCRDAALLGAMLETASSLAVEYGFAESGFRVVVNTNEEGGQTVFHLHMHVLAGRPLAGKMG